MLRKVWIPQGILRANHICVWWRPTGFTPSALGGLKLCAATSMSTSQHDCISNSKFQQKTHNHIHTTYGFGLLGTFPHKSICLPTSCVFFHFSATHFTLLCITRCLFNKEEEASGQRDISQSEEKRQTLTEWRQAAAAFPMIYTTCFSFFTKWEESPSQSMWILLFASCFLRPTENHCPDKWRVMCSCNLRLVHPQVIVYALEKIDHKLTAL